MTKSIEWFFCDYFKKNPKGETVQKEYKGQLRNWLITTAYVGNPLRRDDGSQLYLCFTKLLAE